jgi:hypothetical protein
MLGRADRHQPESGTTGTGLRALKELLQNRRIASRFTKGHCYVTLVFFLPPTRCLTYASVSTQVSGNTGIGGSMHSTTSVLLVLVGILITANVILRLVSL